MDSFVVINSLFLVSLFLSATSPLEYMFFFFLNKINVEKFWKNGEGNTKKVSVPSFLFNFFFFLVNFVECGVFNLQ